MRVVQFFIMHFVAVYGSAMLLLFAHAAIWGDAGILHVHEAPIVALLYTSFIAAVVVAPAAVLMKSIPVLPPLVLGVVGFCAGGVLLLQTKIGWAVALSALIAPLLYIVGCAKGAAMILRGQCALSPGGGTMPS